MGADLEYDDFADPPRERPTRQQRIDRVDDLLDTIEEQLAATALRDDFADPLGVLTVLTEVAKVRLQVATTRGVK